jgi:hypothetical protein
VTALPEAGHFIIIMLMAKPTTCRAPTNSRAFAAGERFVGTEMYSFNESGGDIRLPARHRNIPRSSRCPCGRGR